MKARHKRMRAGNAAPINAGVYSGASSNVVKEAHEKSGKFKRGGAVHHKEHHKAEGHKSHRRMDRKARGGSVGSSPFSTAAKLANEPREGGTDSHND